MRARTVGGIGWLTAGLLACAAPVACAAPTAAQERLEGRWPAEARMGPEAMTLLLDIERLDGELRG